MRSSTRPGAGSAGGRGRRRGPRLGPSLAVRGTITFVTAPRTATPPTTPTTPAPASKPELTHACVRCGRPVPLDVGLCERCNPLGLRDSSSSQVHGIAVAGVIAFVVILGIVGKFALSGIGPFEASVANAATDGNALAITLSVTNRGSSDGQTTCRITDPSDRTGNTGGFMLSPKIGAGQTIAFTQRVTELGSTVRPLAVECSTP